MKTPSEDRVSKHAINWTVPDRHDNPLLPGSPFLHLVSTLPYAQHLQRIESPRQGLALASEIGLPTDPPLLLRSMKLFIAHTSFRPCSAWRPLLTQRKTRISEKMYAPWKPHSIWFFGLLYLETSLRLRDYRAIPSLRPPAWSDSRRYWIILGIISISFESTFWYSPYSHLYSQHYFMLEMVNLLATLGTTQLEGRRFNISIHCFSVSPPWRESSYALLDEIWSKRDWYGDCQVGLLCYAAESIVVMTETQHISNTPIPTSPLIHSIPMWRCLGNIARNGPSPKTIFQNTLLSTPGEWSV